jgi:hypothetical protein
MPPKILESNRFLLEYIPFVTAISAGPGTVTTIEARVTPTPAGGFTLPLAGNRLNPNEVFRLQLVLGRLLITPAAKQTDISLENLGVDIFPVNAAGAQIGTDTDVGKPISFGSLTALAHGVPLSTDKFTLRVYDFLSLPEVQAGGMVGWFIRIQGLVANAALVGATGSINALIEVERFRFERPDVEPEY